MDKEYYSIGEVAKICNINIRTLHYYNDIDLLVPERVDEVSHYRYYSDRQIMELMIIKEYKAIGFSLKEVKSLLKRDNLKLNKGMLEQRCEDIDKKVTSLLFLKKRLKGYIDAMEQSFCNEGGHIFVREFNGGYGAYLDYRGKADGELINGKFIELISKIEQSGMEVIGDRYAIFHGYAEDIRIKDCEIRFFIPVRAAGEREGFVCHIPRCKVLSIMHFGANEMLGEAYERLAGYVKENQLSVRDLVLNRFIINTVSSKNEDEFVTEIMLIVSEHTLSGHTLS